MTEATLQALMLEAGRPLTRHGNSSTFIFNSLASQTVRTKFFVVYKLPRLQDFYYSSLNGLRYQI